ARKRSAVAFTYTLDVKVGNETALRERLGSDRRVSIAPDDGYRYVARAPDRMDARPVVIGTGPGGLFAGLLLAQMGFRPGILDRGKYVRVRSRATWSPRRVCELCPETHATVV